MSADPSSAEMWGAVAARLATDAATVEVVRALRVQNIRTILIKGAAIADRLYDDTEQRFYGDVDLLVEQRALGHAQRVLHELDFRPILGNPRVSEVAPHASAWTRARPMAAAVDLHTGVHFCTRDPDALWAEFTRHTRQLELAGTAIEILDDPAQAFVIVTHALHHCRHPKPLEDLGRALLRIDRPSWAEAAAWPAGWEPGRRSPLVCGSSTPARGWRRSWDSITSPPLKCACPWPVCRRSPAGSCGLPRPGRFASGSG